MTHQAWWYCLECVITGTLTECGLNEGINPSCSTNTGHSKFAIYYKEE